MSPKKTVPRVVRVGVPLSEYPWPLRLANALDDLHLWARKRLAKWLRTFAKRVAP